MSTSPPITESLLLRCVSGAVPGRGEKPKRFFTRVSHYNLQNRNLASLDGIELASGSRVLYLYDNHITSLAPLSRLRTLGQLYIENNELTDLDVGMGGGPALEKVFAGGNVISRISAATAASLPRLTELHLAAQRINNLCLVIETNALETWGRTLRVLDISKCGIKFLTPFSRLRGLIDLKAANNPCDDENDAAELLIALPGLKRLDVRGTNFAMTSSPAGQYRDVLTAVAGYGLEWLDGRDVTAAHKSFQRIRTERSNARSTIIASAIQQLHEEQIYANGGSASGGGGVRIEAAHAIGINEFEGDHEQPWGELGSNDDDDKLLDELAELGRAQVEEEEELSIKDTAEIEGETRDMDDTTAAVIGDNTTINTHINTTTLGGDSEERGGEEGGNVVIATVPLLPLPSTTAVHNRGRETGSSSNMPRIGGIEGFQSLADDPPLPLVEATSPRRTPSDFEAHSRFSGGFALPGDREKARMYKENEAEVAKARRMTGGVRTSPLRR
jgi:hypothetical protein